MVYINNLFKAGRIVLKADSSNSAGVTGLFLIKKMFYGKNQFGLIF